MANDTCCAEDALLGAYVRADRPLTVADLATTYPRIDPRYLDHLGASLERRGWIVAVPEGGHVVTEAGREQWYCDDAV